MPYKADEPSVSWISDSIDLKAAVRDFESVVGIDSEFKRTNTFYPIPALYQVASGNEVFLLDPLFIEDLSALVEFLEDEKKLKVLHACQEDLELFASHMSATPQNVFDTQFADAFLSDSYSLSYANLAEEILRVGVKKNETRSDWLQRPLTAAQIEYAVDDVIHLVELFRRLELQLQQQNRISWFREDISKRASHREIEPAEYYKNIKRAWQLDGSSLAILKELGAWREIKARKDNLPRRRVVWDEHLIEFAKTGVLTMQSVRSLLPPEVSNQYGVEILARHKEGRTGNPPENVDRPLSTAQKRLVKEMKDIAQRLAQERGFSFELLGRKRDLEECVRFFGKFGRLSDFYAGWRSELIASDFLKILNR